MTQRSIKRALISVYDKTGVVDFARALVNEFGIEIISTGGTAALLKDNGIPVTLVEEVTGFPELLDGRVKTLHPKIFAGILADRDNPEHMRQLEEQDIKPIDMVVVNLYPFEKTVAGPNCTFEQAIEMIDIGGVSLLRAAAKNLSAVITVCLPDKYRWVVDSLRENSVSRGFDLCFASYAFDSVLDNDAAILKWLSAVEGHSLPQGILRYSDWGPIRYGENPHQKSSLWRAHDDSTTDLTTCDQGLGVDFQERCSLTNYLDLDAGVVLCRDVWRALNPEASRLVDEVPQIDWHSRLKEMSEIHCACLIKHTNACGFGISRDPLEAYRLAYLGDPMAAMGGFLICSFSVTPELASSILNTYSNWGKAAGAGGFFLDGWAAPSFDNSLSLDRRLDEEELDRLVRMDKEFLNLIQTTKEWGKRVRLFETGYVIELPSGIDLDYKSILGGLLVQDADRATVNESDWKVVTKRKPADAELADLRLAWLIAKHTKSNAISICKDGMLIGNGAGQMSRVMSCRIAVWLAQENGHAEKLKGSVAASDGFFPFDDGPKLLMDAGVTAIIQPGGSKRDEEVIRACDERDVAMIFTGIRHFKH